LKEAIETIPVAMDQAMHVLIEPLNGDLILETVIDLKTSHRKQHVY